LVEAKVVKAFQEVKTCTVGKVELQVEKIFIEVDVAAERLPFNIEDAQRPETEEDQKQDMDMLATGATAEQQQQSSEGQYTRVLLDTRLNGRVIDLRVNMSCLTYFKV
jgi:aspartyl-tRNA synthetase